LYLQEDIASPKPKDRRNARHRNRTLTITALVLVATVVVVGAYILSIGGRTSTGETTPVPSSDLAQLSQVANSRYGTPSFQSLAPYSGAPLSYDGKPVILFVSGDFCPYCAAERWALVIALMRFGTFSSLSYTYSGSNIELPNTPSFSFLNYSYSSQYISLQAYEFEDRNGKPLESVPANYSALWSAVTHGDVPFLDIANSYVVAGAQYGASLLAGLNQEQVVQSIVNGDSLGKTIMAVADGITSAICNVTQGSPAGVCGQVHTSASSSSYMGSPSSSAEAWAMVQYAQTEWTRKTSAPTR
jgi:thiol-disulfide isomerase/thioredoxin